MSFITANTFTKYGVYTTEQRKKDKTSLWIRIKVKLDIKISLI